MKALPSEAQSDRHPSRCSLVMPKAISAAILALIMMALSLAVTAQQKEEKKERPPDKENVLPRLEKYVTPRQHSGAALPA